jgi:2-hydroxy-6-oxonona-2,4-dienedioate hydrolase
MRVTRLTLAFGLATAAAAAVGTAFATDLRAGRARLAGRSRLVHTASGLVEVAEAGHGPPVLVVHGAAGGFDMGLRVGVDVLGDDFHVLAPSRFGYLGTPMPTDASLDDQADALAALLDALEVATVAVVAVSAGAQPATRLALRHPERVRALVLITPALYLPPPPGAPDAGPPDFVMDHLLGSDLLVWAVARLAPRLIVRVAGVPRALDSQVTPEDRERVFSWFFPAKPRHVGLVHDMRTTTPTAPDLPIEELRMPVMLVSAEDDPYLTADVVRYSARRLPAAKVLVCESGGHVLLGQDDRVADEVRRFLTG